MREGGGCGCSRSMLVAVPVVAVVVVVLVLVGVVVGVAEGCVLVVNLDGLLSGKGPATTLGGGGLGFFSL